MRGFHFGAILEGEHGSWGMMALHLQCPWRLELRERVLTGQADLWAHARLEVPPDDWTYNQGDSYQDGQIAALLGHYDERTKSWVNPDPAKLVVETVTATVFGDLTIALSGGYILRVFPDSTRGESWRIFSLREDGPHFVFGAPE